MAGTGALVGFISHTAETASRRLLLDRQHKLEQGENGLLQASIIFARSFATLAALLSGSFGLRVMTKAACWPGAKQVHVPGGLHKPTLT